MRRRSVLPFIPILFAMAGPVAAVEPSTGPAPWGDACAIPASPGPEATAACGPPGAAVPVAVIEVSGEVYRIELTTPVALAGAYALATGESAASIPSGLVMRGDPGPNAPWSWHIDPATLEWAEMTTEVCDGLPTQIQDGVLTHERFCPWTARLLAIEHDPDAPDTGWTSDGTDLPVEAGGGTSTEDRTFARRLVLEAGAYTLRWTTAEPLDPTVSSCLGTIALLAADGSPAPASGSAYPTLQPDDRGELTWPDLPMGGYDLFVSIDCGWSISFGPASSSAS